jgi:ferric-dicitrate binding protein FerR (iron transport regulator)
MNAYETSQDIDDQAADWAARRDRAPLSEEENRQFKAWLSGDPRRRGAFCAPMPWRCSANPRRHWE